MSERACRSRRIHRGQRATRDRLQRVLNEAGEEVSVVQVHPAAASMQAHIALVAERAQAAYAGTLDATVRIQVFGQPSEETLTALKQQAGEGAEIALHPEHLGGFTRVSNRDSSGQ